MHTLVLLGELDHASAAALEAAIERLCETELDGITLDLSKLTRIDATGVAVIAFRCRWCERHGFDFALIEGTAAIQQVFAESGALEHLPFLAAPADRAAAADRAQSPDRAPAGAPQAEPQPQPADANAESHSYLHAGSHAQRTAPAL